MADALQKPAPQPADPDLAPLGVKLGIIQPWRWCLNRHPLVILLIFSVASPGLNWLSTWLNSLPYVFSPSLLSVLGGLKAPLAIFIMSMMLRDGYDVPASYFPVFKPWWQRIILAVFAGIIGFVAYGALQSAVGPLMLWLIAFAGWVFTIYAIPFQASAILHMFVYRRAWEAWEMWAGALAVAFLLLGVPVLQAIL